MPTGIYVYEYIFIVKVGLEHVVKMVFKATVFYLKNANVLLTVSF